MPEKPKIAASTELPAGAGNATETSPTSMSSMPPASSGAPVSSVSRRRRRLLGVAAGILFGTFLLLALIEAALWIWRPVFRPYGLTQRPNGLIFNIPQPQDNRQGFIDIEHSKEKAPGDFRVIGIDGSLGATGDIRTNIFSVMRRFYRASGFRHVEVINHCVPNSTVESEHQLLTLWTLDFSPDVVVLLFDAIQFLAEREDQQDMIVADGLVFFNARPPYLTWYYAKAIRMRTVDRLLRDEERIDMPWWKDGVDGLPTPKEKPARISYRDSQPGLFSPWEYLVFNYKMMHIFKRDRTDGYLDTFRWQMDYVSRMRDACRQHGVEFAVALFPVESQTNPHLARAVFDYFDLDPAPYDYAIPYDDTLHWLEENGIPVIGLLEAFQAAENPVELYPPRNAHLSDYGMEVSGKAIAKGLTDKGLVPPTAKRGADASADVNAAAADRQPEGADHSQ